MKVRESLPVATSHDTPATRSRHLGTGIFRCGRNDCVGLMRVSTRPGSSDTYTCRECRRVSRVKDPTDAWVTDHVIARLEAADFLPVLMSHADENDRRQALSDIARLETEMKERREMVERGEMTRAEFVDHHRRWEFRLQRARDAARPAGSPEGLLEMAGANARHSWDEADVGRRRAALDWLVEVIILPVGRGNRRAFDTDSVRVTWRDRARR